MDSLQNYLSQSYLSIGHLLDVFRIIELEVIQVIILVFYFI